MLSVLGQFFKNIVMKQTTETIEITEGNGFCIEYQRIYDAMTNKPSASVATAQNNSVVSLINAGIWKLWDVFYGFDTETNDGNETLINWINPGTDDATVGVQPTFTSLEGITGNGTTMYLKSYNPFSGTRKYLQDDCSVGVFNRTKGASSQGSFGALDIDRKGTSADFDTTRILVRINQDTQGDVSTTYVAGWDILTRSDGSDYNYYNNKVKTDLSETSLSVRDIQFNIGAHNDNGTPSTFFDNIISRYFAGGAMTEDNVSDLVDIYNTYLTAVGKSI